MRSWLTLNQSVTATSVADERLKLGDVCDDDLGILGDSSDSVACRRTAMTTSSKLSLDKEGWRKAPGVV